jgi:C4-dicarboxylate transporter
MPQPEKSPLADKIEKIGDRTDEVLSAAQASAGKVLKRLGTIILLIAAGIVAGNEIFKAFQEKTAPILEKSGVETVEQKEGAKVFRVNGVK